MLRPLAFLLCATAVLAGCSGRHPPRADQAPANPNADDPALTGALADQIMVDPDLGQQADGHIAGRTPLPVQAGLPLLRPSAPAVGPLMRAPAPVAVSDTGAAPTLATLALERAADPGCQAPLGYSAAWATRLPAAMPIYPEGQVQQAAGADAPACHLRIIRFVTGASPDAVMDYYYTRARRAGYTARHGVHGAVHSLAGAAPGQDAAFYVDAEPQADAGTAATLLVRTRS